MYLYMQRIATPGAVGAAGRKLRTALSRYYPGFTDDFHDLCSILHMQFVMCGLWWFEEMVNKIGNCPCMAAICGHNGFAGGQLFTLVVELGGRGNTCLVLFAYFVF